MGWLQSIQEKMLLKYLLWKGRTSRIRAYLQAKKPVKAEPLLPGKARVAAVQGELVLIGDPLQYADLMYQAVHEAVSRGAQLVAFPEDNATHLVGMLPGLTGGKDVSQLVAELGEEVKVADIFNYLTPVTKQVYFAVFSELAALFGVFIMAGSIVVAGDNGKTVNEAYLFGPDGSIIGRQQKLHLLPLEEEWGLSCGNHLSVYDTPVGKLAFPICMDATYFETFRIAAAKGAQTVIIPTANPDQYNFWKELRGIWPRVQESAVFGIKSSMVGDVMGLTLTGRSGIFAPLELTPNKDGILAQAETYDRPEVVVADLDYQMLQEYRQDNLFTNYLNTGLCRRYLPQLY